MPSEQAEQNKNLNDTERDQQAIVLRSKPQRIVFETTNRCNLRCEMCGQSHRTFDAENMTMDIFRDTEPFWTTAYDVTLFGWGEPLLNPHLCDFFDLIRVHGARTFILTNGMLLTADIIERLVDGDLTFLNFSFDGIKPETYNQIRRGSDFHKVLGNIKKVVAVRKTKGKSAPYLRMVFVGMRQNIEEFPGFVELCAELGMDEAKMVYMIAYGDSMKDQVLFHYKELTNHILDEAEAKAQALGIKLNIPDRFKLNSNADRPHIQKHKFCCRPWEELFVQSDGKVRLCMLSCDIVGDLNRESATEIWNGERLQYFRKTVNSDGPKGTCAHCPQYSEMNVNDISAFIQTDTELPGERHA